MLGARIGQVSLTAAARELARYKLYLVGVQGVRWDKEGMARGGDYSLFYGKGQASSSVGLATGYGLDSPGIECRWGGEIFRTCPDRTWGPPSLLYNGYRVFSGGKERPGHEADPSPLLVPWS